MNATPALLALSTALLVPGCIRARAPSVASTPPIREVVLTVDASVTEIPPDAKELRLWIPVPRDEGAQSLLRVIPDVPGAASVVADSKGNPSLLVILRRPASSAAAKATFEVSRAEQRGPGTPHPLAHAEKTKDPGAWLADEALVTVDDRVRSIAREIFATAKTHPAKARAAWSYVLDNMRYSKEGAGWGQGSVAWACDMKYGNCTDFHSLFIALLRAGGVPARFRMGFSLPSTDREGTLAGYHCWAEWWNPDRGWTPVDASEAWKQPERREFLFGNLDRDRIGISLGRDLTYDGQRGPPRNYSVFPYAEVDGTPVTVATTVTFRTR